jgi:hypothetical protein
MHGNRIEQVMNRSDFLRSIAAFLGASILGACKDDVPDGGSKGTGGASGAGAATTGGTGGTSTGGTGGTSTGGSPNDGGDAGEPEQFDYYISPDGNDANDGLTPSTAWAITAINDAEKRKLYAGKRVGLLDGTYGMIDMFGQPAGGWTENALSVAAGTAEGPTVIKAVHARMAILDGQSSILGSTAEQGIIGPGGAYVTLDGLAIINGNYIAVGAINIGDFLTVQNCSFDNHVFSQAAGSGKNAATIFLQNVEGATVRNCRLERGGAPADGNRHDFILVYGSRNCLFENLTITNIGDGGGNGIYFKVAGEGNQGHTVRNCYINRTGSSNGTSKECIMWTGTTSASGVETIENNVLVIDAQGAPLLFIAGGTSNTIQIEGNTFVGGSWNDDGGIAGTHQGPPAQLHVSRNIFARAASGFQGDVRYSAVSTIGSMDYNLYDASPPPKFVDAGGSATTGLASWQSLSGKDANSAETTDPLFVGVGKDAEAYRLEDGSPGKALGAGGTEVGAWGGQTQIGSSF